MLWIKAFHLFFVIAWFVSLFYLPRLMVYHVSTADGAGHDRFCLMEKRLYTMGTIGMIGTWVLGLALLMNTPAFMQMGWLHAKLTLVVLLSGYHGWLKTRMRAFAQGRNTRSAKFYRIANEVPSVLLIGVLILVVVKPF
ncbi:protoporphyrinogen oxidase HemJ [Sinimarinibacterium sp. NLF-5-8]|uniref:protoporphyrinogen oxidase HemJ n=1 Tax=Sinimarinibacterium sp. NLF-5-8 TaxID=2698684 RepID=UPI00137C2875|nr:protoporphyrinogen oxidase HemJ [Sinimarinibacterium sp. NLF-5-8]QHS11035.1 protoporphyrinogen oxidase HemJ [Sinimarinibacterium sp. NLF-5-8]